jgi:hypothetical protein
MALPQSGFNDSIVCLCCRLGHPLEIRATSCADAPVATK